MHIHVHSQTGEAKFWMEPEIAVAQNHGLSESDLRKAMELVEEHADEIRTAWGRHFGG